VVLAPACRPRRPGDDHRSARLSRAQRGEHPRLATPGHPCRALGIEGRAARHRRDGHHARNLPPTRFLLRSPEERLSATRRVGLGTGLQTAAPRSQRTCASIAPSRAVSAAASSRVRAV